MSVTPIRVKEFREIRGLTKSELALCAGVTERTVRNLEQGLYQPSVTTAVRLAEALGVPLSALFAEPETVA